MALLTDTKARNIKPDDKPLPHGGITGLTLHPSNSKDHGKWVLCYVTQTTNRCNSSASIQPGILSMPDTSCSLVAPFSSRC